MRNKQRYILFISFAAIAYVLLPLYNADYLYTIQDNDAFIAGNTFMRDTVNHHGGWATWIACYLTQYFYYPWLGTSIIVALWAAIYAMTCWLFSLRGWTCAIALAAPALLMLNVLDYGYWIYYAKTPGFAFMPTVMTLFICMSACVLRLILMLAKVRCAKTTTAAACLVATGAAASFSVGTWRLDNHTCSIATTLFDRNFRHELSMYRALDDWRFDDVIDEARACDDTPTNLMVMYKNAALLHTGHLRDMFDTSNCGIHPSTNDSPKIRTSRLGASLIYYMYGLFNFSYRWAMENSVQYGLSFRSMKMMARCAIMNGEHDVANKYLTILRSTTFHRDWANEHTDMLLNSTKLVQDKEYSSIEPLMGIMPDALDSDNGLCEAYIMDVFAELPHTTAATEDIALCMSLWGNNAYAFCVHFHDYVERHPDNAIPSLYQQGAILLGNLPESPITLDGFEFDPIVANKYNAFVQDYRTLQEQGMKDAEAGQKLKAAYGDTYWWHYYFCPEPDFY